MPEDHRARLPCSTSEVRTGIFDNAALAMAYVDPEGRWLRVNPHLLAATGYVRDELMATTLPDMLPPPDAEVVRPRIGQLWKGTLESYRIETRFRKRGGDLFWVDINLSIERDEAGAPAAVLAIIQDIELRKAAEERQRVLVAELNHHVRNTLATVQAIATQTLRQSRRPERFVENFVARLQALSAAHDLLSQTGWEGVDLATLIRGQVTLAGGFAGDRVQCAGPAVVLPPRVARTMSLALHELAANAVEHGALSVDGGRVDVRWDVDATGETPVVKLDWIETGGPPARVPERTGFGTLLIEHGIVLGLDAKTVPSWRESGLLVEITVPVPREARPGLFRP